MSTKYGLNIELSSLEHQNLAAQTHLANKAFFEVNSLKAKQVIEKANKVFAKIWPEDEPSDCIEMSQRLLGKRKQYLAPIFIFIKKKCSQYD